MYKLIYFALFLIYSCISPVKKENAIQEHSTYKVIGIIDGDTYDVLIDGKSVRIRMFGIDAPERGMPYYKVSKKKLSELCFNKMTKLEVKNKDRNGRTVAISYLEDGTNINLEMIKEGLAWHYTYYSDDIEFSNAEATARQERKGLWADETPIAPWEIRKLHKEGVSTKDLFKQ
jgi:micrococcal nuclease